MSDTILKNKSIKELFQKLTKYYVKDDGIKFKEWLNSLKDPSNVIDGKISGLLNSNKITLETSSESGTYNLILLWIIQNEDKFQDYDFDGIPSSSFIDIENKIKKQRSCNKKSKNF